MNTLQVQKKYSYVKNTFIVIGLLVCISIEIRLAFAQTQSPAVPEIADYSLASAARAVLLSNGQPAVLYNPNITRNMSLELQRFFRAHEYGHIVLQHIYNPNVDQQTSRLCELAADRYAVQMLYQTDPTAINAVLVFYKANWYTDDPWHPSGAVMYENIQHTLRMLER